MITANSGPGAFPGPLFLIEIEKISKIHKILIIFTSFSMRRHPKVNILHVVEQISY